MRILAIALTLSSAALIVACATHNPPTAKLAVADVALHDAMESDAAQYAPLELQQAREKFDRARREADEGHYEKAERLAEEAHADARLAAAKARAEKAQRATEEARRTVDMLRQEAERPTAQP